MILKDKFMLKYIRIVTSVIITMSCSSCIQFKVSLIAETQGFNSGYNKLKEEDKKNIIFLEKDEKISDMIVPGMIYAIQSEQLRDFIAKYDSCVIYFWSAHCSGTSCVSPAMCQKYCDKNNYQLIIIAEYYAVPEMYNIMPLLTMPLFTINTNYYQTNYCNLYIKRFKRELLKNKTCNKFDRYLIFTKGEFSRSVNQLF
jgi:hypothetical protein